VPVVDQRVVGERGDDGVLIAVIDGRDVIGRYPVIRPTSGPPWAD